jgi:hypothetical protein
MSKAPLNACIMVGYVAGAAVNGITLSKVEIETSGQLDLRGFLGGDQNVKPGYESIQYTVKIRGNGTAEQFRQIHEKRDEDLGQLNHGLHWFVDGKIVERFDCYEGTSAKAKPSKTSTCSG